MHSVLDRNQLEEIHSATLIVLERTGLVVRNDDALEVLRSAGCEVDGNRRIAKFPRKVIDDTVRETSPQSGAC